MKIEQKIGGQLELTLKAEPQPVRRTASQRRPGRRQQALLWFREMHRVVDEAVSLAAQPLTRNDQHPLTTGR
jgi:hypothetical protein